MDCSKEELEQAEQLANQPEALAKFLISISSFKERQDVAREIEKQSHAPNSTLPYMEFQDGNLVYAKFRQTGKQMSERFDKDTGNLKSIDIFEGSTTKHIECDPKTGKPKSARSSDVPQIKWPEKR